MTNVKEEIITEKELSKEQKEKLAKQIAGNFTTWDDERSEQIATAKRIMDEVYLRQPKKAFPKGLEWRSDLKLNAVYNIKKTKKAVMWREMWSNPSNMFDVRGTNEQTEKTAKQQKAALVSSLLKMEIGKQYDRGMDDLYDIGEIIFKTDWEQRSKVVKRPALTASGFVMQNLVRLMNKAGFAPSSPDMKEIELPYYSNARVEAVSPFMFVFDAAKWDFTKRTWDSLIKISKRFALLEDLKADKNYTITQEMIDELNEKKEFQTTENKKLVDLRSDDEYGGRYSVLYAHGDFKIDGKVYKNYIAEVLAGKYLIRFEQNPLWVCPFILCALEYDPKTKRGISQLKPILDLCEKEESLVNTALDVQKLTLLPPMRTPKGAFSEKDKGKDGNLYVAPGKLIEYDETITTAQPEPMLFNGSGISDLIGFFTNRIADVSSVSSVMYGNIEESKRTATELSLADKGSSSQASKELDVINQDLTLPMIENVAELLAMFNAKTEKVYFQEKGKNIEYEITAAIRQAQYEYYYEDRNAMAERKSKFQELFQLFKEVGQNDVLFKMIDWKETIVKAVEMIGFDNSDSFFAPETPLHQMMSQIEQMPPQMQEQLGGAMMQAAQQQMQQIQMQQQMMKQGGMPNAPVVQ